MIKSESGNIGEECAREGGKFFISMPRWFKRTAGKRFSDTIESAHRTYCILYSRMESTTERRREVWIRSKSNSTRLRSPLDERTRHSTEFRRVALLTPKFDRIIHAPLGFLQLSSARISKPSRGEGRREGAYTRNPRRNVASTLLDLSIRSVISLCGIRVWFNATLRKTFRFTSDPRWNIISNAWLAQWNLFSQTRNM